MKKNTIILLSTLILCVFALAGCGNSENITGKWKVINIYGTTDDTMNSIYDFSKEGQLNLNGENFTYATEKGVLTYGTQDNKKSLDYIIKKDTLYLNYKSNDKVVGTTILQKDTGSSKEAKYSSKDIINSLANNFYNLDYSLYTKNLQVFEESRLRDEFVKRNSYLFENDTISNEDVLMNFTNKLVDILEQSKGSIKVKKVNIETKPNKDEKEQVFTYNVEVELEKGDEKTKKTFTNEVTLVNNNGNYKIKSVNSLNLD